MAVDPNARKKEREEKGWSEDGPGTDFLRVEGKIVLAVAGWERFNSSQKGTPGVMMRFVAVEGEHAGEVVDGKFWLTDAALGALADWAIAFGWEEPFNEKSDDDFDKIVVFGTGVLVGHVKASHFTKKDGTAGVSYEPRFFSKYKGQKKASWAEYIKKGEASFAKYLEWREKNPRPLPGTTPAPQQQQQQNTSNNTEAPPFGGDDDIPF